MSILKISAVIPSRGDVDLKQITDHLRQFPEIDEILIGISDTTHTRYRLATIARNPVVYTQDDDCLTDLRPLIEAWERQSPSDSVIINAMTPEHAAQYPGRQTLLGFGTLFPQYAASRFFNDPKWAHDAVFFRESDRVFATIYRHFTVFPRIEILPQAHAPNRMWKQPDHIPMRDAMNKRIFEVTGIRA